MKTGKRNKAQFAIEFIVLIAFMFIIFLGFTAVITSKILESRENSRQQAAEDIAALAKNEIDLAKSVSDGYVRTFNLPSTVEGNSYGVSIVDNRELVVNYIDKEYVAFLPQGVCGDMFIPSNIIDKENGVVCANSNLGLTECQNAQDLGLCNSLEQGLLPGTKCCCCSRYGLCC